MRVENVFITNGVKEVIPMQKIIDTIRRYENEDWGDICDENIQTNEDALIFGDRIVAMYHTEDGIKFYIITESDRDITTVLLAGEY